MLSVHVSRELQMLHFTVRQQSSSLWCLYCSHFLLFVPVFACVCVRFHRGLYVKSLCTDGLGSPLLRFYHELRLISSRGG